MRPDPVVQAFHSGTAFDLFVVKLFILVSKFKCQLVGRVILENYQDEALFNRFPYGIDMERFRQIVGASGLTEIGMPSEQLQRLGFGSGCRRHLRRSESGKLRSLGEERDQPFQMVFDLLECRPEEISMALTICLL